MKRSLLLQLLYPALLLLALTGCQKKGQDNTATPYEILFKAEATAGSVITDGSFGYDGTHFFADRLGGTVWISPKLTVPANTKQLNVRFDASGLNPSSTLTVLIYVNGILKKQVSSTGTTLSITAFYELK